MQREETDACEMARTSVLGPNSRGLSAPRCGTRFGHDIEHRQQFSGIASDFERVAVFDATSSNITAQQGWLRAVRSRG